ncbi:penicillin-insensitive murein endopeptidase [Pseudoalteromonas denitrificans]|uniref:penicillin-insensitive murein endopeptidase n=1 Tax=Pseudoalteromonas denitrificans TaxID=43656 RepID=UPI001C436392|nr:penicillin-insensitive murein endopeptidase [Pseudoalteromonas denitrificans]
MNLFTLVLCFFSISLFANTWQRFSTPFNDKSVSIGAYNNGCLSGAKALPERGLGYQIIRASRNRFYGHPNLIQFIEKLAEQTHNMGIKDLLIADMSMPRGGNFISGHASHQTGLDVDIWLKLADKILSKEARENVLKLDVVNQKQFSIKHNNWRTEHVKILELAAKNPKVARIFVNPVIKQQLCNMSLSDNAWLRKIRPWWGHTYHMHVRLACPLGNHLCLNQKQPEVGTGCNALAWWRRQMTQPVVVKNKKRKKKTVKIKPIQCKVLLAN